MSAIVGRTQLGLRVIIVFRIERRDERWWLDRAVLLRGRRWMWFVTRNPPTALPAGSAGGATAGCHAIGFDLGRRAVLLDERPGISFDRFNVILFTGAGNMSPAPMLYDRVAIDADLASAKSGPATEAITQLSRRLRQSPQIRRYLRGLPATGAPDS